MKSHPTYTDLFITEDGKCIRNGKVLKQTIIKGYYHVTVRFTDKRKCLSVARLVCETYHSKPDIHPVIVETLQVNHIDLDKLNNGINNLEWVTPSQNIRHRHGNRYRV